MEPGEYYVVLMENHYQDIGGIMSKTEVIKIEKDKLKALKCAVKTEIKYNKDFFDTQDNEFSKEDREYIDDYLGLLEKIDDVSINTFEMEWNELRCNFFSAYDYNMCIDYYEGFKSTVVRYVVE